MSSQQPSISAKNEDPMDEEDEILEDNETLFILERYFNYSDFKSDMQKDAIEAVLRGNKDIYISMPPASGKSLIYQLPSVLQPYKLTLVICPILAGISDPLEYLRDEQIREISINSQMRYSKRDGIEDQRRYFRPLFDLYFTTPKMLLNKKWIDKLVKNDALAYVVVDDAFFLSYWEDSYRDVLQAVGHMRSKYPQIPWVAITAAATSEQQDNIYGLLQLKRPVMEFKAASSFRSNIYYEVVNDTPLYMVETLAKYIIFRKGQTGIIYCNTKDMVRYVTAQLKQRGIITETYYAGMEEDTRKRVHSNWEIGDTRIICTTVCFKMGVDKNKVDFIINWGAPDDLTFYYHGTGRAGRDGGNAFCCIFYSNTDGLVAQKIEMYLTATQCRHKYFSEAFADSQQISCGNACDVCQPSTSFLNRDFI